MDSKTILEQIAFTSSKNPRLDRCYPSRSYFQVIDFLIHTLKEIGFPPSHVQKHSFSYQRKAQKEICQGQNIWAATTFDFSSSSSSSSPIPIFLLGAHYDTVEGTNGFDDNASGVASVLRIASTLIHSYQEWKQTGKDFVIPHSTSFVLLVCLFDAEEYGLFGSSAFASHPPREICGWAGEHYENITVMINIDSLFFGDDLCCYGNKKMHPELDKVLKDKKLSPFLHTNPNDSRLNPFGYRMIDDASDHVPFDQLGVPVIHIEATNWFAGPPHYGGMTQTMNYGSVWDTPNDFMSYVLKTKNVSWEECVETRLNQTSMVVLSFISFNFKN